MLLGSARLAIASRAALGRSLQCHLPPCCCGPIKSLALLPCFLPLACSVLQLACVEHHLQQPLSCLATAAASGSRRKLQRAIRVLPQEQLLRCCSALATSAQASGLAPADSRPDVAAAQQAALAHLQAAAASRGARRGPEAAAAAGSAPAVLEGAVWGAMTAFQQWRMALLMLNLVAKFTGARICLLAWQPVLLPAGRGCGCISGAGVLAAAEAHDCNIDRRCCTWGPR